MFGLNIVLINGIRCGHGRSCCIDGVLNLGEIVDPHDQDISMLPKCLSFFRAFVVASMGSASSLVGLRSELISGELRNPFMVPPGINNDSYIWNGSFMNSK
jgi:hypothetical protein